MGQKPSDSKAGRAAPLSNGQQFQVRKPEDNALTITTQKETATIRGISGKFGQLSERIGREFRTAADFFPVPGWEDEQR